MDLHEYASYDAVGLRDLIRTGDITAAEVDSAARRALEIANADVNGLALPVFDQTLDYAASGPLAGVPFLIKDAGPVAEGVPFFNGSRSLPGFPAAYDTDLMGRFRSAGLATLGLTTVPEMLISFSTESVKYGPTRNPWDLERGVGGSSGGAAALVAAGAVPMAHANDGAGSIRIPASCCGLVGLKPTRGRTSLGPDLDEFLFGMHCDFALTRTVRDAAQLLDAVHGPGIGDKYTAPPPLRPYVEELRTDPAALRVAITTQAWSGTPVDGEVAAAAVATGRMLEHMGHTVLEASPEIDWEALMNRMAKGLIGVALPWLMAPRPARSDELEAVSWHVLEEARKLSAVDLMLALDQQNRLSRVVGSFFTQYDVLVTPTLGQLPAPHGTLQYDNSEHTVRTWLDSLMQYGPFTALFNITGQPAISLPLGWSTSGLPIGVQIVAGYGREDLLFQIASRLEEAMPWTSRVPAYSVARR
ncbi:amidase family protein [Streptomyces sp. NPDC005500]|uniref:amidase n=1 Tax=Streptomyces sp. NPDC005500 TaxID=3155007 RepID=UPI0033A4019C